MKIDKFKTVSQFYSSDWNSNVSTNDESNHYIKRLLDVQKELKAAQEELTEYKSSIAIYKKMLVDRDLKIQELQD